MDMDAIEADVDATRCSTARVADAKEQALALKRDTMQIDERDEWARYKRAKCYCNEAEQLMRQAKESCDEAASRWRAVMAATNAHVQGNALAALANRTADRAYKDATRDINLISELVKEVTQNCKDASEALR